MTNKTLNIVRLVCFGITMAIILDSFNMSLIERIICFITIAIFYAPLDVAITEKLFKKGDK